MEHRIFKISDTHYIIGNNDFQDINFLDMYFDTETKKIERYEYSTPNENSIKITHSTKPIEYRIIHENKEYIKVKPIYVYEIEEYIYGTSVQHLACSSLGYDYYNWKNIFSKDTSNKIYQEVSNWCLGYYAAIEQMRFSDVEIEESFLIGISQGLKFKKEISDSNKEQNFINEERDKFLNRTNKPLKEWICYFDSNGKLSNIKERIV